MAQYDINVREYWRILKKRRILVILTAIVLGVFSTIFAILRAPTPLYTSVCSVKFEKQTTLEGLYSRTISWPAADDIKTQMSIIKSHLVFQRVAERLRLIPKKTITEDSPLQSRVITIVENLQSKVEVTREENTNILNIRTTDRNAVFAQRLANTTALTYKALHAEQQMKRTTEALKYVSEQLRKMRRRLQESEDEFNRFSQENQLVSIDLQSENLLLKVQKIQDEVSQLREDRRELEGILHRLNEFLENPTGSGYKFYSQKAHSDYQATNKTLVGLVLKRDTLLEDYTPQHPEVVAINRKIMETARKMAILLQLQISDMGKNEINLKKQLKKVDRKIQVLMDKKVEFERLKRKVQLHTDMTALLEQKNQEILIRKAEKPEEVTIVKPALLPTKPMNPPKTAATGAMGAIIGVVLGLVLAFVVETFDTSLGAIEDVEMTLGTQVLGVIPHADEKDIRDGLMDKYPEGKEPSENYIAYLIPHFAPKSMMAESFRALRTNIQFKDTDKRVKTIAVTSTSPKEGKTMVTIGLATTMAQAGMKVLLVGSDLRKPMLGKVFGVETTPGLTDVLLGNYPWRDTVKTVTDMILGKMSVDEVMMTAGLDNLHIITSGPIPSNPAELIDSSRLQDFIEEAKEEYDLVLFDSTPVLSAADAAILGTKVDGVLLVYRVGTVSRGLLKRATTQLEQIHCNIMGAILNGMRPELSPDFHDYGYYKYYYAYGDRGKDRRRAKHRKGFSWIRKGEESQRSPKGEILPESMGEEALQEQGKKHNLSRLSLMVVALAFLAMGILWHHGMINPFKLLNLEGSIVANEKGSSVKNRRSNEATQRKAKAIRAKPRRTVSKTKPAARTKTSIPSSVPLAKDWAEVDTPASPINGLSYWHEKPELKSGDRLHVSRAANGKIKEKPELKAESPVRFVKKRISSTATQKKPEVVFTEPKITLPIEKPALGKGTSMSGASNPASSTKTLSFPYSLYLGSFRTLERAKKAISLYSKKGLSPYWVKMDFRKKGIWFRVYSGYFAEREEGERFIKKLRLTEAKIKNTQYANLIGTYSSDEIGLKRQIRSLKKLGYSPYTITDHDGKCRLFVGGFFRKTRAVKQHRDLKSQGIQSRVVLR